MNGEFGDVASKTDDILDAAERRIREAGYNGFSFRDIAADVGIKSASVHHHFPTKPALAAAVARRYADRFLAAIADDAPVSAWRDLFRRSLREDGRMCLCGVLGAEAGALPPEVAAEAKRFFQKCADRLAQAQGGTPAKARDAGLRILASLEGAMLVARALDDPDAFDRATGGLV